MSDNATRKIRSEDNGVGVELYSIESEEEFDKLRFEEVHLLSNGWVEGRKPLDEEGRRNFFPPSEVHNIIVYDEDGETVTSTSTTRR